MALFIYNVKVCYKKVFVPCMFPFISSTLIFHITSVVCCCVLILHKHVYIYVLVVNK